jgi:hypothetical protein
MNKLFNRYKKKLGAVKVTLKIVNNFLIAYLIYCIFVFEERDKLISVDFESCSTFPMHTYFAKIHVLSNFFINLFTKHISQWCSNYAPRHTSVSPKNPKFQI